MEEGSEETEVEEEWPLRFVVFLVVMSSLMFSSNQLSDAH